MATERHYSPIDRFLLQADAAMKTLLPASAHSHRPSPAIVQPDTKMSEPRMVALAQQYGSERIIINSAADWGKSDPLKVPKTAAAMAAAGISEADIETIVWHNPIAFFEQGGRLRKEDLTVDFDQKELFEGNSVLRGQEPKSSS